MKENPINLPPFYVGQRVVALRTSRVGSAGVGFVKDVIYTVVRVFKCNCGTWRICVKEVPAILDGDNVWCCIPATEPYCSGEASKFAPIESTFQSISLTEVLELETPLICVN